MKPRSDTRTQAAAAQAIERVLRAEQDAEAAIAGARQLAQATLDRARDDALAIVNRAAERIARWQRGHAAALERRIAVLRDQAAASAETQRLPDEASIAEAAARVAARLAGEADTRPRDVDR